MFECCTTRIKPPKLRTYQILDEAIRQNLIDIPKYDILVSGRTFYPDDWTDYNPNIYLPHLPRSNVRRLSDAQCIQFYIGLMKLHTSPQILEMYKPPCGQGFMSVIKAIAYS